MSAMPRYAMVIEADRCVGCYNCFLACRDEHAGNDHRPVAAAQPAAGQRWIDLRIHERGTFPKVKVSYVPVPCLHCAEAPCLKAASAGAVYRRPDGIVLIDPGKAVGQRAIVDACPYGAVFWNESETVAQKCTLCAHLLDAGWKEPRCVEACPTGALVFGDATDPSGRLAALRASGTVETLEPEHATRPLIGHRGLPRRFVAGEIVLADDPDRPAAGVRITLRCGDTTRETRADAFGDFGFDDLPADASCRLTVVHPGYRTAVLELVTDTDRNVGAVLLERATA
jgi:Fe-S-cluster-containing dehydrogenase component